MNPIQAWLRTYGCAILALACLAAYPSEQLDSANKTYAAEVDKVAFEATLQKEELLGRFFKRLDALASEAKIKGDTEGARSAQEMKENVLAAKGPYLSPRMLAPLVAAEGQKFALDWARLGEMEQQRRLAWAQKLDGFLIAQRTRLTKENKMAEARIFFDRSESLAREMTLMREGASRIPTGANPYVRKTTIELETILHTCGLGLRVSEPEWMVREMELLAFQHARDALLIRPIRYPHAHHKMVVGRRPLQVGDEIFAEISGADSLELMSTDDIRKYVSYKIPNRLEKYRLHVRRLSSGADLWLNDVPLPIARLSKIEDQQREAFLKGGYYFVIRFGGSDTVGIQSFAFRSTNRLPGPVAPLPLAGQGAAARPARIGSTAAASLPKPREGKDWQVPSLVTATLRWIPPGRFNFGSTAPERAWASGPEGQGSQDWFTDEIEREPRVLNQGFWLGETEVTQAQFSVFARATGYRTEAEQAGRADTIRNGSWASVRWTSWQMPFPDYPAYGSNHPVLCVSANDAEAFCAWLTAVEQKSGSLPIGFLYRLPSELEWEYACWGGRKGARFWWSDIWTDGEGRANGADQEAFPVGGAWTTKADWKDGFPFTSPAGHYGERGANGYGLQDMVGNAWEWTTTRYDAQGNKRVLRGGAFNTPPGELRCANRGHLWNSGAVCNNGFRLCLSSYEPQEK